MIGQPRISGPLGQRAALTIVSNDQRAATIIRLLLSSGPLNIGRLVAAVVVNPIKRMRCGRARANVGVEVSKYLPSLADRDAAPAITCIAFIRWILAPLSHTRPDSILWGAAHSVPAVMGGSGLAKQATTRAHAPIYEIRPHDAMGLSAFANTLPVARSLGLANHSESPKGHPGNVACGHRSILTRRGTVSYKNFKDAIRTGLPKLLTTRISPSINGPTYHNRFTDAAERL